MKQQKRPSPSTASAEELLLSRWHQSGCSGVPGRSQAERQGGHGGHLPNSRPAWHGGRQAGRLQAQRQRGGAGACAELPLRSLPRDGGHRAEWMSKGAAGRDGEPWLPPGDVPRQQRTAVTGAISENPSVWYAAPHHNIQRRQ